MNDRLQGAACGFQVWQRHGRPLAAHDSPITAVISGLGDLCELRDSRVEKSVKMRKYETNPFWTIGRFDCGMRIVDCGLNGGRQIAAGSELQASGLSVRRGEARRPVVGGLGTPSPAPGMPTECNRNGFIRSATLSRPRPAGDCGDNGLDDGPAAT